jgi:hypothetical protein
MVFVSLSSFVISSGVISSNISGMPSEQYGLFLLYSRICPVLFLFSSLLHLAVVL